MNTVLSVYDRLVTRFKYPQSIFLLLIRIYWGWQLIQTGWGKLHHLDTVTEYFQSINVPMPGATAHAVGLLELGTGILWILGLFSRPISAIMTINLIAAYWFGDHDALSSVFSDPAKFYNADPFTFLFVAVIVLLFGSGFISVDALIRRFWRTSEASAHTAG